MRIHYVSDRHVYVLFVFVSSLVESHFELRKKAKFECEEFALSLLILCSSSLYITL